MDFDPTYSNIIGGIVTLVVSVLGFLIKKLWGKIDSHSSEISTLQVQQQDLKSTSVTDGHVRTIVREENQPLIHTLNKMADSMDVIKDYIAEKRGEEKALAKIASARRSSDSGNQ